MMKKFAIILFVIAFCRYSLGHKLIRRQTNYCFPALDAPRYGYFLGICKNSVGSSCEFGCVSGYELVGEKKVTCNSDNKWSSSLPHCMQKPSYSGSDSSSSSTGTASSINNKCSALTAPTNGRMQGTCGSDVPTNAECYFSCDTGYNMRGYAVLRCKSDGQWTQTAPKCQKSWINFSCVEIISNWSNNIFLRFNKCPPQHFFH